ncbi:MAG: LPS-assembly protein LptD [Planctomycetes bacterium]|nr:LPS-assembly protein LptD [Planctomycetota bacterium]
MRRPFPLWFALLGVLLRGATQAQEPPAPEPIRVQAAHSETWERGGTRILMASGNIYAWQGTREKPILELYCDQVVIWFTELPPAPDGAPRTRTEFYAEGNVRLYRGGPRKEYFGGNRLVFDLAGERGYIEKAKMGGTTRAGKKRIVPLYVRAEEFRIFSKDLAEGRDVSVTICEFGEPHHRVQASRVELVGEESVTRVKATSNVLYAGSVPVFYVPYAEATEDDTYLIKDIRVGNSNRMGTFGLFTWGEDIGNWGKWRLHTDYRSKRGPATGGDIEYKSVDPFGNPYSGRLSTYYARDHGEDFDKTEPPENRWRIHERHRHEFPEDLRLDLEVSRIRDRNFLREYFEREDKEDKEQETYAFLRKRYDNHLAWALVRPRVNEWQTQTEYLPQLGASTIAEPVLDENPILENLLYTQETDGGFVRREFDERLEGLPGEAFDPYQSFRIDTQHRLDYPFQISWVRLTPFAEGRYTQYDRVLSGETKDRWAAGAGSRLSANLWRVYDGVESSLFDLHRLQHIVSPEIRYENLIDSSLDRERLLFFDEVETLSPVQEFRFRVTNRLKTRRFPEPGEDGDAARPAGPELSELARIEEAFAQARPGTVEEFLFLRTDLTYFPDPEDVDKENPWGIADYDFRLRPRRWLTVTSKFEWDFETDSVRSASGGVSASGRVPWGRSRLVKPDWQAFAGLRHIQDNSLVAITQLEYDISPKWSVLVSNQYDFNNDSNLEARLTVRRTFHEFVVDFNLERDEGEDETSFTVALSTTAIEQKIPESVARTYEPDFNFFRPSFKREE